MDQLIQKYPYQVMGFMAMAIAATLGALHKLGWLRIGRKAKETSWNGAERRECATHPHMQQKVCALYTKIESIDEKLDAVAEKLQFVLGTLEARWGKK